MAKRYAGEPIEKPVVSPKSTKLFRWGGQTHPKPPAGEFVEKINQLHQEGLTAEATTDPELIRITYDSYDDLEAVAALMRKERIFLWRYSDH